MPPPPLCCRPPASFLPVAALLGALSLATVPVGVAAQALARTDPSQYDLELKPGQRESRPLFLHNLGRERVKVRLRLADLRMNERGALDLLPAGTLESTLARELRFEPRDLVLEPGERRVIRLEMTLPADGPATRYGVILSNMQPADSTAAPGAPAELGTTLFLTRAPRSSIRTQLVGLEARVRPEGTVSGDVRVRNHSARHASCTGEVKLSDSTGVTVDAGLLADGIVLPGAVRVFGWEGARRLPAGRYTVTVTIDTGEPELLVGQKEVVVGRRGPSAARDE